jgi:hypothetical protein
LQAIDGALGGFLIICILAGGLTPVVEWKNPGLRPWLRETFGQYDGLGLMLRSAPLWGTAVGAPIGVLLSVVSRGQVGARGRVPALEAGLSAAKASGAGALLFLLVELIIHTYLQSEPTNLTWTWRTALAFALGTFVRRAGVDLIDRGTILALRRLPEVKKLQRGQTWVLAACVFAVVAGAIFTLGRLWPYEGLEPPPPHADWVVVSDEVVLSRPSDHDGDAIDLIAAGRIRVGRFLGCVGPEGTNSGYLGFPLGDSFDTLKASPHACLLYRGTNTAWAPVKWRQSHRTSEGREWLGQVNLHGDSLFLRVNDRETENNGGAFLVRLAR